MVQEFFSTETIESAGQAAIGHIKNAGVTMIKFLLALLLSYIFILERKQIREFLERLKTGNFSFFYDE